MLQQFVFPVHSRQVCSLAQAVWHKPFAPKHVQVQALVIFLFALWLPHPAEA